MNVVGHQTPSPNLQVMLGGVFAKQIQIDAAILRVLEDGLPGIAALRYVVGNSGCDHASHPGHGTDKVAMERGNSRSKWEMDILSPVFGFLSCYRFFST